MAQEDDDGNSASHNKPTPAKLEDIDALFARADELGVNEDEFLKYLGSNGRALTLEQLRRGNAALDKKAKKGGAQ